MTFAKKFRILFATKHSHGGVCCVHVILLPSTGKRIGLSCSTQAQKMNQGDALQLANGTLSLHGPCTLHTLCKLGFLIQMSDGKNLLKEFTKPLLLLSVFSLFSLQSSISYELMMEIKFSVSIDDGLMQRSP